MKSFLSITANIALYGFLLWLLYDSIFIEKDYWFTFVIGFVLVLSVIIGMIPYLHVKEVSPGKYDYDD